MFFAYGFSSRPLLTCSVGNQGKEPSLTSTKEDPKRTNHSAYRPPHLRRRENLNKKLGNVQNSPSSTGGESLNCDLISSDSDHDSDGQVRDTDIIQNGKVRVAAIICIQVVQKDRTHLIEFFVVFTYLWKVNCCCASWSQFFFLLLIRSRLAISLSDGMFPIQRNKEKKKKL